MQERLGHSSAVDVLDYCMPECTGYLTVCNQIVTEKVQSSVHLWMRGIFLKKEPYAIFLKLLLVQAFSLFNTNAKGILEIIIPLFSGQ